MGFRMFKLFSTVERYQTFLESLTKQFLHANSDPCIIIRSTTFVFHHNFWETFGKFLVIFRHSIVWKHEARYFQGLRKFVAFQLPSEGS